MPIARCGYPAATGLGFAGLQEWLQFLSKQLLVFLVLATRILTLEMLIILRMLVMHLFVAWLTCTILQAKTRKEGEQLPLFTRPLPEPGCRARVKARGDPLARKLHEPIFKAMLVHWAPADTVLQGKDRNAKPTVPSASQYKTMVD